MPKGPASNSGLMQGMEQSGEKVRGKGITKEGRRELRCLPWWARPGGDGGSSLAGGESRPALEETLRRIEKAHAPQLGDRDHRASPAGGSLICADEARALSPLLTRTDRLLVPDLVVGAGRRAVAGYDASAVCA